MVSLNPVRIFKNEAEEEKGEIARMSSFIGAIAVGDLVKTTLGPKGMDKILVSHGRKMGSVEITNDGATILKSIGLDNPAAKVLVNLAKVQDEEVGDGTTSVTVFAAELLKEAERLIEVKIHPQTIIAGWRSAIEIARRALEDAAVDVSNDEETFISEMKRVAYTTLSSKILQQHIHHFADLAVKAVRRLSSNSSLESIQIIKKAGGTLNDSYLDDGFLLDKKIGQNQPKKIVNAKILIANTPMDTDKVKVFGSRVRVDSIAKVAELEFAEKMKMKDKVDKILAHGCNVFINRQLIYNYPEQLFADAGIMAIEHADFDGIERLALVTGGEIVSTFDLPEIAKLGTCDTIEEVIIGEDRLLKFSGVSAGEACTIIIRGASHQIMDEAERSLHDALCVLMSMMKERKIVYGGGCSEIIMASAVVNAALVTPGKEALAMEAFATALLKLPTAIADNGGFDSAELITTLKAEHNKGNVTYGLDMDNGAVACMQQLGIREPLAVKRHMIMSGSEAAEMILRVDNILKSAPRKRTEDRGYC